MTSNQTLDATRRTRITPRLARLVTSVPFGTRTLVDLGTDHALVPVEALRRGRIERAIATDASARPLDVARRRLAQTGLTARVELRQGDGFAVVAADEGVDAVCIAGLGGGQIVRMLDAPAGRAVLARGPRLVLNPLTTEHVVRAALLESGFELQAEHEAVDGGRTYTILVAEPGDAEAPYRALDWPLDVAIRGGPWLCRFPTARTRARWTRELDHLRAIAISARDDAQRAAELADEIATIQELVDRLNRLRRRRPREFHCPSQFDASKNNCSPTGTK